MAAVVAAWHGVISASDIRADRRVVDARHRHTAMPVGRVIVDGEA